jgi:hypothetical protein
MVQINASAVKVKVSAHIAEASAPAINAMEIQTALPAAAQEERS